MSNLQYFRKVISMMNPTNNVGQIDGDRRNNSDSLIKDKSKNKNKFRVDGDRSNVDILKKPVDKEFNEFRVDGDRSIVDILKKPVDQEFDINKLDEYGDQSTVDSLTESEILEFDLEFIETQSNKNINMDSYKVNTEKNLQRHQGLRSALR